MSNEEECLHYCPREIPAWSQLFKMLGLINFYRIANKPFTLTSLHERGEAPVSVVAVQA